MENKITILTLYGNYNYGNKLQNYAVQQSLKKITDYSVVTCRTKDVVTYKSILKNWIKFLISPILKKYKSNKFSRKRTKNFLKFDKYITTSNFFENKNKPSLIRMSDYNYYIVGSDQVWNPHLEYPDGKIKSLYDLDFIKDDTKKIAFSASFGVEKLPVEAENQVKQYISKFKCISVREESGKKIIENLTGRKDVVVLLDPTMLLETSEWDKVLNKPEQIEKLGIKERKYILNYFLGNLNYDRKKEIERVAKENDCIIINILDKNDPFYLCGPSEFIWLEKNAFLICTDSFHSSVFAILYNRPFIVFNRDDGQTGKNSMNSRLETLLSKFKLENRYYKYKITNDYISCDYSHVEKILKDEREKAYNFLKEALE